MSNWLDAEIGYSKEFNKYRTVLPDDPAIDAKNSNIEKYLEDNLNTEHLVYLDGKTPVEVEISLPTASQWSSIIPHLRRMDKDGEESVSVVLTKLFEMCVAVKDVDAAKKEYREGFYRLPDSFMSFMLSQHPVSVEIVGSFIIKKYTLSAEEKKV